MFGLKPPEGYSTYPEYVRNWRRAVKEAYNMASALVEQDNCPCPIDGPDSEGEVEDPEQPSGTTANEATHGAPLRQSQCVSKPPLRMTYDAMGQPSFHPSSTEGIQGITVSYPQQLWQPVPWMIQQPVMQPNSYFVPLQVPVQPIYPVPMWCY